jgi:hypothetical protein
MGIAFRTGAVRTRASPREPALRRARICYDHLAGELGVMVYEGLIARRAVRQDGDVVTLTPSGRALFASIDVDSAALDTHRRTFCRACLDWSERRYHLAGGLGAALLTRIVALGWAKRVRDSRVIAFTPAGEAALHAMFGATATPGGIAHRRKVA